MIALGLRWGDMWNGRLEIQDVVAIVVAAPPGSSLHHAITEGWGVSEHLQAHHLDVARLEWWAKTEDSRETFPQHRPEPIPRPGAQIREKPRRGVSLADYHGRVKHGDESR